MTIVAFEKEVSLKAQAYLAKRLFDSTEVLYLSKKKTSNIYKWKEKVQKNTQLSFGGRREVQVTKFAFDFIFVKVLCCELGRRIA